jgi:tRNA A-37 threonylcarbamoyl transferase component Bud32
MGVVYQAQDPAIGRTVAVKSIRIGELADPREQQRVKDRIFREAQSAGVLSHPHIVTIYDIQEEGDIAYIFMEYIEGSTLEKMLLDDKPPEKEQILTLLRQTAAAIDFAHSKGIVHRDIKPANIMVRKDWTAKIADFGIAKMQSQSLTQTGLVVGTPNYMSPEQIQGKPVDGQADQFSLGVIAYEVMTGEKPFVADSLPTLLFKLVGEPAIPAVRLNPTLDVSIDAVLQKALSKDPAQRWDSCSAFIAALEEQCRRHPNWTTQTRGQVLTAATEAIPVQPAPIPAPTPDPAPAPTPAAPRVQPPAPAPAARPVPPAPERIERPQPPAQPAPAPKGSNTMVIAAAGLVALLLIGFGLMKFMGGAEEVATTTPTENTDVPVAPPLPKPMGSSPKADTKAPAAPPVAPPPPDPGGTNATTPAKGMVAVNIRSTPPGATVIIDSGKAEPCTTPCSLDLAPGRHVLVAQLDKYESANKIFMLPAEAQLNITLRRQTGTVAVSSSPAGAQITVDGIEYPEKTPAILTLPVGRHKVTVSMPGRGEKSREFNVDDGAQLDYSVNFGGN